MMDYRDGGAKPQSRTFNQGLRGDLPSLADVQAKEACKEREVQRERQAENLAIAAIEPMKEIPAQMNRLFNVTDNLEQWLQVLEQVLEPVLGAEYNQSANTGQLKSPNQTGLGSAIDEIVERLERVAKRMDELTGRVQV